MKINIHSILVGIWLAAALSLGVDASAATTRPKITGIYSDMRSHASTGDVLGVEVFIVMSRSGHQVIFQDAEGSPAVPVVVPAKIQGNRIEFELPERPGYSGKFTGLITVRAIVGQFADGQQSSYGQTEFRLKRKLSYWQ